MAELSVLQSFLYNSDQIFAVIGSNGQFIFVNNQFCDLLGYTSEELCSRPFTDFVHPDDCVETFRARFKIDTENIVLRNFRNRYKKKNEDEYVEITWRGWLDNGYVFGVGQALDTRSKIQETIATCALHICQNQCAQAFQTLIETFLCNTKADYGHIGTLSGDKFVCCVTKQEFTVNDLVSRETVFKKSYKCPLFPTEANVCAIPLLTQGAIAGAIILARTAGEFTLKFLDTLKPLIEATAIFVHFYAKQHIEERARIHNNSFVSQIAHEFKTPLNGILGFAQLIKSRTPNDPYIDLVLDSGNILSRIIAESLNFTQLDEYVLNYQLINVKQKISEILARQQVEREARKLEIEMNIANNVNVQCDEFLFVTVWRNLISNAVKYTDENGKISFSSVEDGDIVTLQIENTGTLSLDSEKIFRPFCTSNKSKGAGLGLSFVKKVMLILQQNIICQANNNTVKFCLTFKKSHRQPIHKIMYVEDNKFNQLLMENILEGQNLTVKPNAEGLLECIQEYDLLLLDWHLNGINGVDIIAWLQQRKIDIPVIILTADSSTETIAFFQQQNLQYFCKPFNIKEFKQHLVNRFGMRLVV